MPTAFSINQIECRSRHPPEPSLRSGSSRCAVEPKRSARIAASSRIAVANTRATSRPRVDPHGHVGDEARVPGDEPDVEHRRAGVQAVRHACLALLGRTDRVTHLEPRVPQRIQQAVGEPRHCVIVRAVMEHEQVDVGSRQQQPSPVPTHRGDRGTRAARRRARTAPGERRPPAPRAGAPPRRRGVRSSTRARGRRTRPGASATGSGAAPT